MKIIKTANYYKRAQIQIEEKTCIDCGKVLTDDDLTFDDDYCYKCKKEQGK